MRNGTALQQDQKTKISWQHLETKISGKCLRMPSCCATMNGTAYGPTSGGSTPP